MPTTKTTAERFTYDQMFQTKIARVLFQDTDFALTLSPHFPPKLFESSVYRWIVKTIFAHGEKYGATPSVGTLINYAEKSVDSGRIRKDEIGAFTRALNRLNKPVPDKTYVKDEVFGFIKAMKLKESVLQAAEFFEQNEPEKADEVLTKYLTFKEAPDGLGKFYIGDVVKRLKRRKNYQKNGIPTDTPLDNFLNPGGIPPKQLGCVIAPPGRGKTLALVHFGRAAVLHNCQVLYVSLELGEEVIEDRFDAAFSNFYLGQLHTKNSEVFKVVKSLKKKFNEALVIKEFLPASLTVAKLRSYLRQLERNAFYPDMICIDYADLMLPSRHYDDAYDELGLIYQELRALAKELNIVIWTASQGNRGSVAAKVVDLSAMADSFKKAAICDVAIGLSQTPKEKRQRRARLYLAKNRNGSSDIEVEIKISPGKQRLAA